LNKNNTLIFFDAIESNTLTQIVLNL